MDKVLIEIHIPAIHERYDIFAPTDASIKEIIAIIADGVAEITNGKYIVSGCEQLCMKEPSGLLNPTFTLKHYGVKDGAQLYLI